jgi:hypothetical protein
MTKRQTSLAVLSDRQREANVKKALRETDRIRDNPQMTREELMAGLSKINAALTEGIISRSPKRKKKASGKRRTRGGRTRSR